MTVNLARSTDARNVHHEHKHTFRPRNLDREDKYHSSFLVAQDDALDFAVQNSSQKGLPDIAVARENLEKAGADVSARVKIIVGSAHESLAKPKPEPQFFDLAFIDADKGHFTIYYTEAKRLLRSGGVIMIDNMIRRGGVSDPTNTEPYNVKIRELSQFLEDDTEVEATTIGTVGVKGYNGSSYIVKK
ncbi:hypothetical protein PQX77_009423 [Marasmius sp. AFHP31]|nr:hypothetical protein PQX77_009423 [Marasmius sp. AFHP31]